MRKSVDTLLLILLLIGPSIILTCVRQPTEEEFKTVQVEEDKEITKKQETTVFYAHGSALRP